MNTVKKNQAKVQEPSVFESLAVNAALNAAVNRVFRVGHAAWVSHRKRNRCTDETGGASCAVDTIETRSLSATGMNIVGSLMNPAQYLFSSRAMDKREYVK